MRLLEGTWGIRSPERSCLFLGPHQSWRMALMWLRWWRTYLHSHDLSAYDTPFLTKLGLAAGTNGTVTATGGGSMNLTTPMTLCQRDDGEPDRGFDGRFDSVSFMIVT